MIKKYLKKRSKMKEMEKLIERQKSTIIILKDELKKAKAKIGDPKEVVAKIFARDIKWFDYEDLKGDDRQNYYDDAQRVLSSKVFENEYRFIVTDLLQKLVLEATSSEGIRDYQMTVNGLELLKERLKEVYIPNNVPKDLPK